MTATELEKCKKYLRATLLASKGGVMAHKVYEMYQEQVGSGIPYRQFNYPSLETFLQSMPDVCRITCKGANRDIYVEGVANSQTKHIEKLNQVFTEQVFVGEYNEIYFRLARVQVSVLY